MRMTTQLNVGGMGVVIGFRYESLPIVLRACQVKREDTNFVLDALRIMERELVQLLNKET